MLASLTDKERAEVLEGFSEEDFKQLEYDWAFWGRPEQQAPLDPWSTWLILAGRGFGKTRTGSEWVRQKKNYCAKIALVGETAADVRDVMIEGDAGILRCSPPDERPTYYKSLRKIVWPNGAEGHCYSGEDPDQLRGPEHSAGWVDELCKMQYAQETWDQLAFGMRAGDEPQTLVTTTPRPLQILRDIIEEKGTVVTRGSTYDNAENLAPRFIENARNRYEGTRLGRQELNAEILDDVPGALWTREMIGNAAYNKSYSLSDLKRVVIGVDPSGSSKKNDKKKKTDEGKGNKQGIVAAAEFRNGLFAILEDDTELRTPFEWGKAAVKLYHKYKADKIVAETNFGGDMVVSTIRSVEPNVPVKKVTASRGKSVRAAPIAALYEQHRVRHCLVGLYGERQEYTELEDQMCLMTDEEYEGSGSPDNVDAAVWALTELAFPKGGRLWVGRAK